MEPAREGRGEKVNLLSNTIYIKFNHYFKIFSVSKQRATFNNLATRSRVVADAFIDSKGHSGFVPREAYFAHIPRQPLNRFANCALPDLSV
jgi:hypothetical protein